MKFRNTLLYLAFFAFIISGCITQSVLSNKEIILGDAAANNYNNQDAITHYRNFCNINSQLGLYRNFTRESEVLRKMAYAYSMEGNFKNALNALENAAAIDSSQNDALNLLDDLRCIGNCYLYMGDYRMGLVKLNECIALSNKYETGLKQTHRLVAANVYLSLGNCYALLSQYDLSDFYLTKANVIFKNEDDSYGLMVSFLKLGINKIDQCEHNIGIDFINQSIVLANILNLSISEHLLALGDVYTEKGDYDIALTYKRRSLSQADSSGNISQLIVSNISLGDLYTEVGDSKTALYYYNNAAKIIEKYNVDKNDASAIIATRKGEFNKSLNFYDGSGATFSKAVTLLKIGISYFGKADYDSCLYYLSKTDELILGNTKNNTKALLNIYKAASFIESGVYTNVNSILDSASQANLNPENEWKIYYYSGRLFENNNDSNRAEESYINAIEIIENIWSRIQSDELKSSFMDKRIEVYDRLINLLNKQGKAEESFNYAEKARNRAFLDMLARRKDGIAHNKSDSTLAAEEQKLKMKIIKLQEKITYYSSIDSNRDTTNQTRSILENELLVTNSDYNKFVTKLRSANNKLVQLIKPEVSDVNSVISETGNNTVLLEYWLSSDNLYIWSIDKSGVNLATVPFDTHKTDLLYESLVYFSTRSKKTSYYLGELYKLLIAPIRNNLKENCNLIIVPHGILHFVPFQALIDEKNSSMVEHYFISYAPSASILKETQRNKHAGANSILAMAIGNLSVNEMPPLASTISEIKSITPLFENSVSRMEKECTIDCFTANAPVFSYIHLATHGVYDSKSPFSSYILFNKTETNDGKLKVSDIFGLKLNANLVTLSACQTGLGNISNSDELVGLSRAFIYAGTPSIIVSLWSVADNPTSKLMTYFYEYLKTNPTNIALTLAQRKLMIDYKEPYFWAPFVLMGSIE